MKKLLSLLLTTLLVITCSACAIVPAGTGSSSPDQGGSTPPPVEEPFDKANAPYDVHEFPSGITKAKNIITDNKFSQGIKLYGKDINNLASNCYFTYGDTINKSLLMWRLAEWSSKGDLTEKDKYNYKETTRKVGEHTYYRYENDYKVVEVSPSLGSLTLRVNGGAEYNYKEREQATTDVNNWAHLLVQGAGQTYYAKEFSEITAYCEFSIDEIKDYKVATSAGAEGKQAAQLVWYLQLITDGFYSDPVKRIPASTQKQKNDNSLGLVFHYMIIGKKDTLGFMERSSRLMLLHKWLFTLYQKMNTLTCNLLLVQRSTL